MGPKSKGGEKYGRDAGVGPFSAGTKGHWVFSTKQVANLRYSRLPIAATWEGLLTRFVSRFFLEPCIALYNLVEACMTL